jgi:hypothetical protein
MNALLAYFDPGAGSLLLQALVGGFGGIVVLGRYLWMHFTGTGHQSTAAAASLSSQELPTTGHRW